jgi:hypothetical protein
MCGEEKPLLRYRPITLGYGLVLVRASRTLSTVAVELTRPPLHLPLPTQIETNIHQTKLTPSKMSSCPLA